MQELAVHDGLHCEFERVLEAYLASSQDQLDQLDRDLRLSGIFHQKNVTVQPFSGLPEVIRIATSSRG